MAGWQRIWRCVMPSTSLESVTAPAASTSTDGDPPSPVPNRKVRGRSPSRAREVDGLIMLHPERGSPKGCPARRSTPCKYFPQGTRQAGDSRPFYYCKPSALAKSKVRHGSSPTGRDGPLRARVVHIALACRSTQCIVLSQQCDLLQVMPTNSNNVSCCIAQKVHD